MNGTAVEQKRHEERKAKRKEQAKRKAKVYKRQVLARRRQMDRARRARQRREQREKTQRRLRKFRFRVKVVRYFHRLRKQGVSEKKAVQLTLERYGPRKAGDLPLSASTIRNWVRMVKRAGGKYHVLRPKSCRPKRITYHVPDRAVAIVFTLRHQFGWGGHRIAAELKKREIASISGRTVYKILDRLGLSVKIYALKGKSDGIAYRRYEKARPNDQWHIDLKETRLANGIKVYICIIVDDHSRYALAAVVGTKKTAEWTAQVTAQTVGQSGTPKEMVSDNGREFVSGWEERLTKFGEMLKELGIEHLTCTPYYPQGNGKAEAFIKTLNRELLQRQTFETVEALQAALDNYLVYYNNYRLHSSLGWEAPVTRFAGRVVTVRGLAGIPGLEPMAADPQWGPSYCDPPVRITPDTVRNRHALALPLA
ncbi:MAG: transposase [Chloroflexi bacterium]|nr:transposase [Chloroflexota bacterium]